MSTTETKVRKIALSRTRYELFEVTHDDSLGREILSRPLNIDEMQQVVAVYNSHADMLEALEHTLKMLKHLYPQYVPASEHDVWRQRVETAIIKAKGGAA